MKNKFIDVMQSKICLRIVGSNPERFVLKLYKNKINILNLEKRERNKIEIIINYADYEKILKLNTIYKIDILNYQGFIKKKKQIFKYYHVLIIIILCIMFLYLLSHMIFQVEIITNDKDMKKRLLHTLQKYEISKYHFQKNFNYLEKVKKEILDSYHDEIEWVEIEKVGTKYILRYEPRIIKKDNNKFNYRHIVAKKNAIIRDIYASSGQIVKNKYAYVKKGDIIISGYIYANDKIKKTVVASGEVYGEVWYVTKVTYPFNYYEEKKTGRKKKVYTVKLFNNNLEIFNFKPFNDKIVTEDVILKNNILPIKLVRQLQEEVIITTGMNVIEEVKLKAIDLAYNKMKSALKDKEYIINYRVLNSKIIDKGIEMEIFFSVCENISDFVEIEEMKEVE